MCLQARIVVEDWVGVDRMDSQTWLADLPGIAIFGLLDIEMKMFSESFQFDFDRVVNGARLLHITLEGGTRGLDCPVRLCVEETGKER